MELQINEFDTLDFSKLGNECKLYTGVHLGIALILSISQTVMKLRNYKQSCKLYKQDFLTI